MADKQGKSSRKPSKLSKVETRKLTEILSRNWLTTRAKRNIMKPTDDCATSLSCLFKNDTSMTPFAVNSCHSPHGRRGRGGSPPPPPHFLEKKKTEKKYTFSNKRNLWWNKNIPLADLAEASKVMIGPFRSSIIWWHSKRLSLQNLGAPSNYIL